MALQDITLEIKTSECIALIGANGSGKSTLARHLNALLLPTAGDVWISGLNTRHRENHREIRSRVGMVFQIPADQVVATVVEADVAFGPENLGIPAFEIRERVHDALARVGAWEFRNRPPHMLSPGQLQRVAIAAALAMRPACLVFDEATAMLDPAGRRDVWRIVDDLRKDGLTIVFITHDMEEAARTERVIALHAGRIALDAPSELAFQQAELLESIGLGVPPIAELARRLHRRFPAFPRSVLTLDILASALVKGCP